MAVADVLTLTVPVPAGTYPSVNHTGGGVYKNGRKSPEYHALFKSVKCAAEEEMRRVGWETATDFCWVSITRYKPTRRRFDPSNMGKCEADALTKAGVWTDDDRAAPVSLDAEYDPIGPDRLVIIVRRRFVAVPSSATMAKASTKKKIASPTPSRKRIPYTGGRVPQGYAICGSDLIPLDEALDLIRKKAG